jgi:uncharacterized cupredoxin-like copper-binding protein
MNTKRMLAAAGATVALGAVAAGCGNSTSASEPPAARATAVKATVSEWAVDASPAKVAAGKVTFTVTNTGKVKHEFVVLRTSKAAGALGTGSRVSEAGNVGEAGDIAPGATKSVTLKLAPGHYALVCNLPSHYRLGMHADLTVG